MRSERDMKKCCPFCKENKKRPLVKYMRTRESRKHHESICEDEEEECEEEEEIEETVEECQEDSDEFEEHQHQHHHHRHVEHQGRRSNTCMSHAAVAGVKSS